MWWFLAALGALAYATSRDGGEQVCIMTTSKDDPSDRCVVSCHRTRAAARRDINEYWADKKALDVSIVPQSSRNRWC